MIAPYSSPGICVAVALQKDTIFQMSLRGGSIRVVDRHEPYCALNADHRCVSNTTFAYSTATGELCKVDLDAEALDMWLSLDNPFFKVELLPDLPRYVSCSHRLSFSGSV